MKKKKKLICPYCHSKNVAQILYGLPAFSKELEKDLEKGKITLGGCVVKDDSPKYHCNDCSKEWK